MALRAGVNLNCGGWYARWLPSAVRDGLVSEAELDDSFATLWSTAFDLGLFDQTSHDALGAKDVDTAAARELALTTALEAQVLLKNDNRTLPLLRQGVASRRPFRLALLGPHLNASTAMLCARHASQSSAAPSDSCVVLVCSELRHEQQPLHLRQHAAVGSSAAQRDHQADRCDRRLQA